MRYYLCCLRGMPWQREIRAGFENVDSFMEFNVLKRPISSTKLPINKSTKQNKSNVKGFSM